MPPYDHQRCAASASATGTAHRAARRHVASASVPALTSASMIDDVRAQHVTSLHGVPYSFELFDAAGLDTMDLPDLRYVTQAGGKLAPDQVRRWARTGREHGWDLFVMYGQTEATARMAYLPPHLVEHAPEAIGVAVPGGSLSVEGPDDELVYRGPNMMLGYAETPADLALGRTVHELHTGDLGLRRPDGLFEVIGRRSRFVKPFGIRTDLDGLEHLLAGHGIEAACAGTDDRIVIAARGARRRHRPPRPPGHRAHRHRPRPTRDRPHW